MKLPVARLARTGHASAHSSHVPRLRRCLGTVPAIPAALVAACLLIATVASPCLAAGSESPGKQNDDAARQHGLDERLQEPETGWREELMRMPIDQVCGTLKRQELSPFETGALFSNDDPENLMSKGWEDRGQPPYLLHAPIDWSHLRAADRSWNYHLNAWEPLQTVLERHSQTTQEHYLAFAFEVAEDWVRQHPYSQRETRTTVEDFSWYDMAVGRRIPQLAYILDAACRSSAIEANRLIALWHSLLAHFDFLADDQNIKFHNNHGFYQAVGQFLAATRFSHLRPLVFFERQAVHRLLRMIDRHFSGEGVHLEHSPDYHYSLLQTISKLVRAGLSGESQSIQMHLTKMRKALAWMVTPGRHLLSIGDTDRRNLSFKRSLLGGSDLLDYALSGGASGEATSQRLAVFPEAGLAVVRSDWAGGEDFDRAAYLAQAAAFHSRVHKQADDLSIVWYDRGTDILIDAGRYGYLGRTKKGSELWDQGFWYSDPKRVYVESTRAHNTVEIDGRSFDRKRSKPYGSALERWGETEGGLYFIETHARQFRTMRHARLLVFRPHEWLLVFDWVWDNRKENHDYRQWFHFAPDLTVTPSGRTLRVSGDDLDTELKVVSLLPSPSVSTPVRGQEEPTLLGWWSEKGGHFEPVTSVNFHIEESPSAVFATLFAFSDEAVCSRASDQRVNTSGRRARFRWSTGQRIHTLSFDRPAEGDLTVDYSTQPRADSASAAAPDCG